ncbi:MAG: DUF1819 family protein [Burkholderiaceae bacterium]|nr:DUF1819 family protein [Burkholderiaceae bacterium]
MNGRYTTQLGAGLGLIDETVILLDLWQPGMNAPDLYRAALQSGNFGTISARRVHDMIAVGFGPRYLADDAAPALLLKTIKDAVPKGAFEQMLFLYTARAHLVLADFVRDVYWSAYGAGKSTLSNEESLQFVEAAVREGKTTMTWSPQMVRRVSSYLTGCCADFGMLERGALRVRRILPYRVEPLVATLLAYDLHSAGQGDNQLLAHPDWALFGLQRDDVLAELKRAALQGALIVQSAAGVTRISWIYSGMEELANVIAQRQL